MQTRYAVPVLVAIFLARESLAVTPVPKIRYAPDVTTNLSTTVGPADVAEEDLLASTVSLVSIGTIPDGARLDGYAILPGGVHLLSFDTAVTLGGLTFEHSDIAGYDPFATTYAAYFQASAHGVPDGVNLLDFDVDGSNLLLVFDTTFTAGTSTFGSRDVVLWDGASLSSFFDAAAAGVPDGVAIDGFHKLASGHLLFSFDQTGTVGGVSFDPEDVLEYTPGTPGTWELLYDGSVREPASWIGPNLGPLAVPCDAPAAVVSGGGTMCAGGPPATIQAALTGTGPWKVTWSDGAVQNGVATSPATRSVSPSSTTTYTVTAISGAICAGTPSGSAPVTVNAVPATPTASNDGPVCAGAALSLSTPTVAGATYSWTGPDGFVSASRNPSIANATTAASGTYSVTVTVSGCTSAAGTTAASINPDNAAPVVTAPPSIATDQTICCGTFGGATPGGSATLNTFVSGGSATDDCTASPAKLVAQVAGVDLASATCFEVGGTTVTFRFQDTAGHIGTATSTATIRMFGDLNLDSVVDPSDMVVLRAYFNFAISPGTAPFSAPLTIADLDHNTFVDPSDMVILRAYFNFVVSCLAP